jgi:hypothetical protein
MAQLSFSHLRLKVERTWIKSLRDSNETNMPQLLFCLYIFQLVGFLWRNRTVTPPLFELLRLVINLFLLQDYMRKTPSWAVFGAVEQGFDPVERRWHRKTLPKKDISGC